MFPLIFGGTIIAAIGAIVATTNRVVVDIDGQRDVAAVIRGLGIKESLDRMLEILGETLDGVAANTAQMTMSVEKNMNVVTADLHDVLTYCRFFMIVAIVYIVLKSLFGIAYWVRGLRKTSSDAPLIAAQGDDGMGIGARFLAPSVGSPLITR